MIIDKCSKLLVKVINELNHQGATVYFVGGCVRDDLMNRPCHDFDIEVFHMEESKLLEVLRKFGYVDMFGKQFGIYKLLTVPEADFALPRKEKKIAEGHGGFDVQTNPFLDMKEAARRRDFTMNAIYFNTKTNEYEDYYGGIHDLNNKIIRVVDPITFKEDPLRVLRLAQFVSRFNFNIDPYTQQICKEMVENKDLDTLSKERVFAEYNKMLLADHPSLGVSFLYDIKALPSELQVLGDIHQRPDYHPEGCVLNHVKLVLDHGAKIKEKTKKPLWFMWACLLHDIGKASTTDEFGHAYQHDVIGAEMCEDVLKRLCNQKKMMIYVKQMIHSHMKLGQYARSGVKDKTFLKLLAQLNGKTTLNDLYYLTEADYNGRLIDSTEDIHRLRTFLIEKTNKLGTEAPCPKITGKDLMDMGFSQGPQLKSLLEEAYDMQLGGYSKKSILKILGKELK